MKNILAHLFALVSAGLGEVGVEAGRSSGRMCKGGKEGREEGGKWGRGLAVEINIALEGATGL